VCQRGVEGDYDYLCGDDDVKGTAVRKESGVTVDQLARKMIVGESWKLAVGPCKMGRWRQR
jgi:hypothetical protein